MHFVTVFFTQSETKFYMCVIYHKSKVRLGTWHIYFLRNFFLFEDNRQINQRLWEAGEHK